MKGIVLQAAGLFWWWFIVGSCVHARVYILDSVFVFYNCILSWVMHGGSLTHRSGATGFRYHPKVGLGNVAKNMFMVILSMLIITDIYHHI